MDIEYIDRATQKKEKEKVFGHKTLSLLYGNSWGAKIFSFFCLPLFAKLPWISKFYGWLQKTRWSARNVAPFIQTYGIDTSEFVETSFDSFNDFFIRKLRNEKRPIVLDPMYAALPADGRYLVFPNLKNVEKFYIKGAPFNLASFLNNDPYARRYADGSMVIARLCPTDYHRFHFVADGIASKARPIRGDLYSVNPIALHKKLSVFWENKREVTELETELFGKILYVEIGATCVGTIHQTYTPEKKVYKGDEKGYFSFGGSCLVILFEKDRIVFDRDLVTHTEQGFETKAYFGQSLGMAPK
jgi:phosphatidylserine decarboxylase